MVEIFKLFKDPIQIFCCCKCSDRNWQQRDILHQLNSQLSIEHIWNYSETVWILEPIIVICITTSIYSYILPCTYEGTQLFTKMQDAHIHHTQRVYSIYFCGWLWSVYLLLHTADLIVVSESYWWSYYGSLVAVAYIRLRKAYWFMYWHDTVCNTCLISKSQNRPEYKLLYST